MLRPHELVQLKALPLFSEMKEESLASLLDAALLQQFPNGIILIHEGDHADFLHVVVEGLVEIFTEQNGVEWGSISPAKRKSSAIFGFASNISRSAVPPSTRLPPSS